MSVRDELQRVGRAVADRFDARTDGERYLYQVGDGAGRVLVPAAVQAEPGEVYIHRMAGAAREVTSATNPRKVPLQPGMLVEVGRPPGSSKLIILGEARAGGALYLPAGGTGVGLHARQHGVYGGDAVVLDLRQLADWMLLPADPPALAVRVAGGLARAAGALVWRPETVVDLGAYLPENAGEARWVAVALDAAGAVAVGAGAPFARLAVDDQAQADLAQLQLAPPAGQALGVVYLYHGQAAVDWPHIWRAGWPACAPVAQRFWSFEGVVSVGASPLRLHNRTGADCRVVEVYLAVGAAPTGADLVVDVLLEGATSLFTDPDHRPRILDGEYAGGSAQVDAPAWPAGAYLVAEVVQAGGAEPGGNLVVTVVYA